MKQLTLQLQRARAQGRLAEITLADLPGTPAEAYAVGLAGMDQISAWKIGGANPWSRKVFDNTEVFFGPLAPAEIAVETAILDISGLWAPLAAPEIMLELGDWQAARSEAQFVRMGIGFEIPASVLPDDAKVQLTGQIADRAGAGALWVGAVQPIDIAKLEADFDSTFCHNDAAPVAGHSRNIFDGPLGAASEFLQLAKQYDMPLQSGQWIATGGLNPAVAIAPGDRLRFAALGASVILEISSR